jgi:hypothetical protein
MISSFGVNDFQPKRLAFGRPLFSDKSACRFPSQSFLPLQYFSISWIIDYGSEDLWRQLERLSSRATHSTTHRI